MSDTGMGMEQDTAPAHRDPKEMASEAVQAVKSSAADAAETAKEKVSEQVAEKAQAATQALGVFADAIRKASDELQAQDQGFAGTMARQAADGVESLTRAISGKRPEEMLEAVRDFGRENPTAFIAGSVLAGFALSRFFRSSQTHGEQQAFSAADTTAGLTSPAGRSATDAGAARAWETPDQIQGEERSFMADQADDEAFGSEAEESPETGAGRGSGLGLQSGV